MSDETAKFDPSTYELEVQERWGDTEQVRQSRQRTAGYGSAEWEQLRAESSEIAGDLALLFADGADPGGADAMALAERHREHIARWFYDVTPAMHAGLGEMYVADPRFTAYWDTHAEGLAPFVRDAFVANAARQD